MKTALTKKLSILFLIIFLVLGNYSSLYSWGFYAHRKINRMAVFTLPSGMIGFFKKHIEYITEHSIDPDKRAHTVEGEAPKHYMDLEQYGHPDSIPMYWRDAVARYTEDTLLTHGMLPYHIYTMYFRLKEAFKEEDLDKILFNAANIGHYIADGCTPLHNTKFYNGRTPEERGVHALWETRVPELTADSYDFFVGRAVYIEKPALFAWQLVRESNALVDTIYNVLEQMLKDFPADKMYTFENRGQTLRREYSHEFASTFHQKTNKMVEKQMRKSILAVGSMWLTAWVDAGQPDLNRLENKEISEQHKKEIKELDEMWRTGKPKGRPNPEESIE